MQRAGSTPPTFCGAREGAPDVSQSRDSLARALRKYLLERVGDPREADELLAQTLGRLQFGAFAARQDAERSAFAIAARLVAARELSARRLRAATRHETRSDHRGHFRP
jgi:hypothetical protein